MGIRYIFSTLLVVLIVLTTSSCNDDGAEITLLTFSDPPSNDKWVFITDESGNILDFTQYSGDNTITLKSNKVSSDQKINITFFSASGSEYRLESYLKMPTNLNWIRYQGSALGETNTGNATIKISNVPLNLTQSSFVFSDGKYFIYPNEKVNNGVTANVQLYKPSTKISIATSKNGTPFFYENNNVTNGNIIDVNYETDFKELDHTFDVNQGQTDYSSGSIYGVNNTDNVFNPSNLRGHQQSGGQSFNTSASIKLGYNNGYSSYKTYFTTTFKGKTRTYYKFGSAPTSIPLLDYSISVTNGDYHNFEFSLSGPFHFRESEWRSTSNGIQYSWKIYSPSDGIQKFLNFPPEFLKKYPRIELETLKYANTTFTFYLDNFTHSDYISYKLSLIKTPTSQKPYSNEYQTITL